MTRDQMHNTLRYVREQLAEERGSDFSGVEALDMVLEELEQEPTIGQLFSCEEVEELRKKIWKQVEQEPSGDAVSREAVREILSNAHLGESKLAYELDKLPSVNVQRTFNADKKHVENTLDDTISRKAVDDLSKELVHTTRDKADFLCNFWEGLQKLPSVNPQPCDDAIRAEIEQKCDRINSIASVLPYTAHREIQELLCEIMDLCKAESEDKE